MFASGWKIPGSELSETIVKSLKKCGISNALDESEDDILYEEIIMFIDCKWDDTRWQW